MGQIFNEKGEVVPISMIEAGPCFITQIKNKRKDGYEAVQIGFENLKEKKVGKSRKKKPFRYLREFKGGESEIAGYELGQKIDISSFKVGDKVKISGFSKGKGFQGAVKRWGFHGRNATHGAKHEERTIGSVGPGGPQRVFKGKKMPGHMGFERVTTKNVKVQGIDEKNNILILKGAVPGRRGTMIEIKSEK